MPDQMSKLISELADLADAQSLAIEQGNLEAILSLSKEQTQLLTLLGDLSPIDFQEQLTASFGFGQQVDRLLVSISQCQSVLRRAMLLLIQRRRRLSELGICLYGERRQPSLPQNQLNITI